jgi:FtsX-like permease family
MALTISGLSVAGWTGDGSSPDLASLQSGEDVQGPAAAPSAGPARVTRGMTTFTFNPGYGYAVPLGGGTSPAARQIPAQLVLLPPAARAAAIPAIATRAFLAANSLTVGSVVPAFLGGLGPVPLRIVAATASFPTVTASGGALIADLGSLQEYLVRRSLPTLPVTQWWLTTAGQGVPPALRASVPAGTDITSAAGLARATTGDPLSAAPQLVLLAMVVAAALLAITGFWVSVAADVRQRRATTALLAALGVTRRAAASQLILEKLLLSLPSAALGLLLGTLVARLLVPAVTLTAAAQQPTPPALTLYDLPQAIPLALVVAILPAVLAALAATRRPDPAADLRAADAG